MQVKKLFKKILKIISLTFLAGVLTITLIILFPQRLFANKIRYKEFTVCSNNKTDDNIKVVLDKAMNLVQKSELYDPSYKYNIILCHNTFYDKMDDHPRFCPPHLQPRCRGIRQEGHGSLRCACDKRSRLCA